MKTFLGVVAALLLLAMLAPQVEAARGRGGRGRAGAGRGVGRRPARGARPVRRAARAVGRAVRGVGRLAGRAGRTVGRGFNRGFNSRLSFSNGAFYRTASFSRVLIPGTATLLGGYSRISAVTSLPALTQEQYTALQTVSVEQRQVLLVRAYGSTAGRALAATCH